MRVGETSEVPRKVMAVAGPSGLVQPVAGPSWAVDPTTRSTKGSEVHPPTQIRYVIFIIFKNRIGIVVIHLIHIAKLV